MSKIFIDTNVFVHWIILSKIRSERLNDPALWNKFRKIRPSFEFLEKIREQNLFNNFAFFTSPLVISEIFYALLDEYRCRRMNDDGVPLSKWLTVKEKFNLSPKEAIEVTQEIENFLDEFGIFNHLGKNRKIRSLTTDDVDYFLISKLILEKNFRTHDAVLISTAANSGCEYFITTDKILIDSKIDDIKIINPESLLQKVKSIDNTVSDEKFKVTLF